MRQKITLATLAEFCQANDFDTTEVEVVVENGSMFVKCHPSVFSVAQVNVFAEHVVVPLGEFKMGYLSAIVDFVNDQGVPAKVSAAPRGVRVPAAYQKDAERAVEDFKEMHKGE